MIFVNFKTYIGSSGVAAESLSLSCKQIAVDSGVEVIACPQNIDFRSVQKILPSAVWTQNVDPEDRGRATGWFPPEIAKEVGAVGTLLNHSEHKLSVGTLAETMNKCKEIGLKTLVFADSVEEAAVISKFQPDYIGYEPPELVGSEDTSVSKAKPEVIEKVVKAVPYIPIIVGAGVKDAEDVRVGLKLGAVGIAVASAVVKAEDQKLALMKLTAGFEK